ncbi:Uncharacterised protein [Mycobacterium tuberculosis]|nr:Uncharacterised protein [Mycobacterium tuberculosis]
MVVRLIHRLFRTRKDYFPIAPQFARGRTGRGTREGRPRATGPWTAPPGRSARVAGTQLKESPQAQEPDAFGLSIVKPCFSIESTKSMVAPVR